jgi:hypothetical protein
MRSRSLLIGGLVSVVVLSTLVGGVQSTHAASPPETAPDPDGHASMGVVQATESEPNENRTTADRIAGNTISGVVNKTPDTDWFVFAVDDATHVTVTLSKPQREGSLAVELHSAEAQVDEGVIPDEGASVTVGDTSHGSTLYFVRVSGELQTTTNYTVTVNRQQTDAFEPNQRQADAVRIDPNGTRDGEITHNDADWFTFTAASDQQVRATLTKPNGTDTALSLALFTAAGEVSATALGDDSTQGLVGDTTEARTRYFVRIAGESGTDLSAYSLAVTTNAADAFEPNENRVQATPIDRNATVAGAITENDVDWFVVSAPPDQRVIANLTKPAETDADLSVQLYTSQRQVDQTVLGADDTQTLVGDTAGTRTQYYVRIAGDSEGDLSPYTLALQTFATDTFEPNEHRDQATSIELNATVTGNITENDVDWFVVTAPPDQRAIVNLTKPAVSETEFTLQLFAAQTMRSETVVAADELSGRVADTTDRSTTYYVRVATDAGTGEYALAVQNRSTDAFEPNENRVQATSIDRNDTVMGEITENDVDWFVFTAPPDQRVIANLTKPFGPNTALSAELVTTTSDIDSVSLSDSDVTGLLGDTAGSSTLYFVRVSSPTTGAVPYTLTLQNRSTDAFEPNENRVQATPIDRNDTVTGEITENDVDWFVLPVDAGSPVTLSLAERRPRQSELSLTVFSPETELNSTTITGAQTTGTITVVPRHDTVYFVRVTDATAPPDRYRLAVTATNRTATAVRPGHPLYGQLVDARGLAGPSNSLIGCDRTARGGTGRC